MAIKLSSRAQKAGLPPGTLIHTGQSSNEPVQLSVIAYSDPHFEEYDLAKTAEIPSYRKPDRVLWVNIEGVHDVAVLEEIGNIFDLHPLVLEDILNTDQRAKIEDYGNYLYIVLRMLRYDDASETILSEQVSLILGEGFVVSFQEGGHRGDCFDPIRARIRGHKGRVRRMGADYLAYCLLDVIVDNYFLVIEQLGEQATDIEEELIDEPDQGTLRMIYRFKRELIKLRRMIWPLREVLGILERGEFPIILDGTRLFFRDVYDHTVHVVDTLESFRDLLSGMLDIYLSSVSHKLNAVMKVLTIISTIFMPLTFIAGVYGMNFKNMPEIEWYYGYPFALSLMAAITTSMLFYFRRQKWI